jgi:hypothetical protein
MISKNIFVICGFLCLALMINGDIDDNCLACICQVESDCSPLECAWDVNSLSCGYYQLKENYWIDCGSPGDSLESCAADKDCSDGCVRAYMDRYASRCTGGREPTCEDYARVHNGGPKGCQRSSTLGYWGKVSACYS